MFQSVNSGVMALFTRQSVQVGLRSLHGNGWDLLMDIVDYDALNGAWPPPPPIPANDAGWPAPRDPADVRRAIG